MAETQEVIEISLDQKIEHQLVKNNVTDAVIAELKNKYGSLRLTSLTDKESYLELKVAAKECSKLRNIAAKICKEGREDAIAIQKKWVAKEKEVIAEIKSVEDPLDAEIERFDAEVERIANKEKARQEETYMHRTQVLTKMGAAYSEGSFSLGDYYAEAQMIKESSDTTWNDSILSKFDAEYQKIEAVRIAEQKIKAAEAAELKRKQDELAEQQRIFQEQQAEFKRKQDESERIEREKALALENEMLLAQREAQFEIMKKLAEEQAEAKRLADIETAINKEKERQEYEALKAEELRKQEELKKAEELASAGDKANWEYFIKQLNNLTYPQLKSGRYLKIGSIAKEKLEEILNLKP